MVNISPDFCLQIQKYLDPPGRPGSFIQLSRSGRNFLTSDKYLEGAKRKSFKEPATPIAIGDVRCCPFRWRPRHPRQPSCGSSSRLRSVRKSPHGVGALFC